MRSNRVLKAAIACALAGVASVTIAQEAPNTVTELETVIVTGSFIRGTAEDTALPVDVITSDDLAKQGSPSMVDLVKSIPAMQGVVGESNQFLAGQSTGTSNVNLRGLGPLRTLVLLNGRRLAASPAPGIGVDTNLLPTAAIGRIEVLKEGAAATYGSDAIGGVVNFITNDSIEGFDIGVNYTAIDGSDGDYGAHVNWGWQGDSLRVLLSGAYRHRSELDTLERDFAVRPYDENPGGSWSTFGNPGAYTTVPSAAGFTTGRFTDPNCAALGNTSRSASTVPGASFPTCYFQFGRFNNLVENEDHYQLFGQVTFDITDSLKLDGELLWARHEVEDENTSPAYAPVQGPGAEINGTGVAALGGFYVIPSTNPGLSTAFVNSLPTSHATAINGGGNVYTSGSMWRPFGAGGNPETGESKHDIRIFDGMRASLGLSGELGDKYSWTTSATFSRNESDIKTPDIVVSRLQFALRGLGGPDCNPDTGTPGVGSCYYYNPFSSGIARNVASGEVNPNFEQATFQGPGVDNLLTGRWMFDDYAFQSTTDVFVADAVLSGELPLELSGGPLGFAVGAQYRENGFKREVNDISNVAINPCVDTPYNGNTTCAQRNGAFSFFGPLTNQDFKSDVIAGFTEFQFPIFESLQAQLAVRYEDYGGNVGATTNPKLSLRWQPIDAIALRASVGSTFRAPPEGQLDPNSTRTLVFSVAAGGYKPIDTFGNPDLEPEEADTLSAGIIFDVAAFKATFDYWYFDFEKPIGNESGTNMVSYLFPNGSTGANRCAELAANNAEFYSRFQFNTGVCNATNLASVRTGVINGTGTKTSGIDAALQYDFDSVLGGALTLAAEGTYVLKFDVGAQIVEGIVVRGRNDFSGYLDPGGVGSQPKLRGSLYADYGFNTHNVRWTVRHIDSMEDTRTGEFGGSNIFALNGAGVIGVAVTGGQHISSYTTHDLSYRTELTDSFTFNLAVINVFDRDPPFARLDLSYDPFTANPLGRYIKAGVGAKF
jgi:iron complex outermembrane receptor protein